MTTPHTPTPWLVDSCDDDLIFAKNGLHIATVGNQHQEQAAEEIAANARFIVRACNAHDEFIGGLKLALQALNTAPRFSVNGTDSYKIASAIEAILHRAEVNPYAR
jgi:hypothetical protein